MVACPTPFIMGSQSWLTNQQIIPVNTHVSRTLLDNNPTISCRDATEEEPVKQENV